MIGRRKRHGSVHAHLLAIVLGLALLLPSAVRAEDFGATFDDLKTALEAGDDAGIADLADYPLAAEGQLDDETALSREDFLAALPAILAQDSGLSAEPETLRDYLLRIDAGALAARSPDPAAMMRAGAFVFTQQPAGWRLTQVFME